MGQMRVGAAATEADRRRLQDQRRVLERVRGVYDRGMSMSELARVAGHDPRRVQNRVQRLTRRLNSPAFLFVLRHGPDWPEMRRRVAQSIILEGRSQRRAAEKLGLSIHSVRREIDRVRFLFEQQQKQQEQAQQQQPTQPLAASR
jgi:DNA-binding CsgD family transcriptional regulator